MLKERCQPRRKAFHKNTGDRLFAKVRNEREINVRQPFKADTETRQVRLESLT